MTEWWRFEPRRRDRSIHPTEISAESVIEAPAERVWDVLTDFERYPEWNPFNIEVKTDFTVGSSVEMKVRIIPGLPAMRQVETLTEIEPGQSFSYGYSILHDDLLRASRRQGVEDLGEGRSRYFTTDAFSGHFVPGMIQHLGRFVKRGFDDAALALKKRAERLETRAERARSIATSSARRRP